MKRRFSTTVPLLHRFAKKSCGLQGGPQWNRSTLCRSSSWRWLATTSKSFGYHHRHRHCKFLQNANIHQRSYSSSCIRLDVSNQYDDSSHYIHVDNFDDDHGLAAFRTRSLSPRQWKDLEQEVMQTHARLDQALCQHTLTELLANHQRCPPVSAPETGPTGIWQYATTSMTTTPASEAAAAQDRFPPMTTMAYTRYGIVEGKEMEQIVLEFLPNEQILSMSLSVDESMIAYVVVAAPTAAAEASNNDANNGSPVPVVRIRHIESGNEMELPMNNGETTMELVGVEFGPCRDIDHGQQQQQQQRQQHAVYLLGADEQGRPDRVLVATVDPTNLTAVQEPPTLLYQSQDPSVMVDVQRTKGCRYVAIKAMTKTSSEIWLSAGTNWNPADTTDKENVDNVINAHCNASSGSNGFQSASLLPVIPRTENVQYHVDVDPHGQVFLLLTTGKHGEEYRMLQSTIDNLPLDIHGDLEPYQLDSSSSTSTVATPNDDYAIYDMDIFHNHIVSYERSKVDGLQRIQCRNLGAGSIRTVPLPIPHESFTPCYHLTPGGNMHYASHQLCFKVESPVNAGGIYTFDLETGHVECIGQSVPTTRAYGFEAQSERVLVPSEDGTMVPMSLVYRKESNGAVNKSDASDEGKEKQGSIFSNFFESLIEEDGSGGPSLTSTNIVLMAYGSYGEPTDLQYNPWHAMLVQRGYILAFAHTRGGGDLGREWYAKGCRENKIRAVEDLEACAKYLRHRYHRNQTSRQNDYGTLTAVTYSAGGVLVGSAMNRHPDLFDNAILTNAFLDVYQTLKNPDLFLTQHEWDEYGSPLDSKDFDARIQSYCPISNLTPRSECPNTLVVGTIDDDNVPFWNAVIYAKKMRECIQDKDRVYLHLESSGGHDLGERRVHVSALEMAFIIQQCEGIEEDTSIF